MSDDVDKSTNKGEACNDHVEIDWILSQTVGQFGSSNLGGRARSRKNGTNNAQTRIFESKAVKPNIIIPLHFSSSLTQLLPRHLLLLHSNLNQKVKQALTATPGCYPNHSAPSTSSSRIFSGRNPDSGRYLDCLYFLKGTMLSLARFPVSSEASLGLFLWNRRQTPGT